MGTILVIVIFGLLGFAGYQISRGAFTGSFSRFTIGAPSIGRDGLIAITLVAIALALIWTWRGTLTAFPSMSSMGQTALVAGMVFVGLSLYGAWAIRNEPSKWPARFLYLSITALLAFGALYYAKGERWTNDPLSQQIIDQRTGGDRYMQWQDNAGRWQRGVNQDTGELLHPDDCRPRTLQSVFIPGEGRVNKLLPVPAEGFDYATEGTCFNPQKKGVRMTPLTEENIPIVPKLRILKTPAEEAQNGDADRKPASVPRTLHVTPQRQVETIVQFEDCIDPRFNDPAIGFCGFTAFKAGDYVEFPAAGLCPYVAQKGVLKGPNKKPGRIASFEAQHDGSMIFYGIKAGSSFRGDICNPA